MRPTQAYTTPFRLTLCIALIGVMSYAPQAPLITFIIATATVIVALLVHRPVARSYERLRAAVRDCLHCDLEGEL